MIIVLIYWIITTLVFITFADILLTVWNKLTKNDDACYNFFDRFWLGLSVVLLLTFTLSFFTPINKYVLYTFLVVSLLYWVWNRKKFYFEFANIKIKIATTSWGIQLTLFLVFLSILLLSLGSTIMADTGLYHTQAMAWMDRFQSLRD